MTTRNNVAYSMNPADWYEDVHFLIDELEKIHPNPYHVHSREAWLQTTTELEKQLPSLEYHQAVCGLVKLVAMVGDGHTFLHGGDGHTFMQWPSTPGFEVQYPMIYYLFSDGLFVRRTIEAYTHLLGKRIVGINGKPIKEVFERIRPFVNAENEMGVIRFVPDYLRVPAFLHASGLSEQLAYNASLTVVNEDGTQLEAEVTAINSREKREWIDADDYLPTTTPKPLYRQCRRNYTFSYLEADRVMYVNFQSVLDENDESFETFCERVFAFVDCHDVDKFVLDIRQNGGGNGMLNQPLVHGLICCKKINQPGKLFVITGRLTFSAAVMLAADVEANTHALFVGEPIGARVNHYGDASMFTLLKSRLCVNCSTLFWQMSDARDMRPWIFPDLVATESFSDFVNHRDPALETIVKHQLDAKHVFDKQHPNRNWRRPSQQQDWPMILTK